MAEKLEIIIEGTDNASGALSSASSGVGGLGAVAGGAATAGLAALAAAAAVAVGAVVGVGVAAFNAGLQIDDAMDGIVVATGATGEEAAALRDIFETVFTTIPTDAGAASAAIGVLSARLGTTDAALAPLAANLLEASRLMGTDVAGSAELLTRVMGDWGVSIEEGAGLLDLFFTASQETGAGMDDLMAKVVQFGAPLRLMGFGLEESVALFAKWEQEGVNAELVMGSLRIAAGHFADAQIPLQEGLQGTVEAIMNAETESEALAIAMDVFGARAGPDMAAAILEGRFAVEDLVAVLQDSEGAVMDASEQTADFGEMWQVVKNKITLALEPIGAMLIGLANDIMPLVERAFAWFEENLVPIIEEVAEAFGTFFEGILTGEDIVGDFANLGWELVTLFGATEEEATAVWQAIRDVGDWIMMAKDRVIEFLTPIIETIAQFVSWKDILIAVGLAIGVVVIGSIIALVQALAPVVLAITAIIGVISVLRNAWEQDWGGIRTALTEAWEGVIRPVLEALWQWLQVEIPASIQLLSQFWQGVLLPAIQAVWGWMTGTLFPALQVLWNWLSAQLTAAITTLVGFWEGILQPALIAVWSWITGTLFPTLQVWWDWLNTKLTAAMQTLATIWETVLKPALEALWSFVQDNVIPVLESLEELVGVLLTAAFTALQVVWSNVLKPALEALWAFVQDTLLPILESFRQAIADGLRLAFEALKNVWENTLKPALEAMGALMQGPAATAASIFQGAINLAKGALEGFKGIIDGVIGAIQALIGWLQSLGEAQAGTDPGAGVPPPGGGGTPQSAFPFGTAAGVGAAGFGTTNNYILTVNSNQPSEDIVTDFYLMQAVAI